MTLVRTDRADGGVDFRIERVLSNVPEGLRNFLQLLVCFVSIHYLVWFWVVLAILFYIYYIGYGIVSVSIVALYIPSFFNGAHRKVTVAKGGKQWDGLRMHWLWKLMCEYAGLEMIREVELDPKKQYIFGFHPHGILVLSRLSCYAGNWEGVHPGIEVRALGATPMFFVPLGRELCLWLGAVDASRSTAQNVLDNKLSIIVYPGGSKEIFLTNPNTKQTELVLNKRLGFIKLAIKNGADLVPTFVFGEKWMLWNPPQSLRQAALQVLKVPLLLFWGRWCTWVPLRLSGNRRMGVVYGKPIVVEQKDDPTDEDCLVYHAKYIESIKGLFNKYKSEFGYDEDETLVIT
ncbi:diacylglycerol O-acyltransferase [Thraustotheca clavata]|uniref:Acyltransferase n=1 Tax=Thraustotheca clavata TaxID=74557 RepID=A0A1V9Y8D3_9STRA|nr:diacylglycerol O-acyltransferase [Thraustotheca clavata]